MDDELTVQQKVSRFASPLIGERSPKRSRKSLEPEDPEEVMEVMDVIDIIEDGDALLVVNGISAMGEGQVGLRVSSFAMGMASPVLKTHLNTAQKRDEEPKTAITLPEADGDAILIICNILHLRNDKLPAHMSADQLQQLTLCADKYGCKVAVGRSTTQWFDRLYHKNASDQADLCKIVEAAYLLDEAVWFARFSSRWILKSSLLSPRMPNMHTMGAAKLALTLVSQQSSSHVTLRMDLDSLVDVAARCFSREFRHYIDWAPEMSPDASETPSGKPPVRCRVDGDGGQEFLGALREAHIWPSDVWFRSDEDGSRKSAEEATHTSVGDIVDRMADFMAPDYDDADRCDFCDGIKAETAAAVKSTKLVQKERLWGLCLDCLKAGGFNAGECRFEHAKPQQEKKAVASFPNGEVVQPGMQTAPQVGGLGIAGL